MITTSQSAHHTQVEALGVLGSPAHRQLALSFLVCKDFRLLSLVALKPPALCTVFTVLSYYPTSFSAGVSSLSSVQLQLLPQFWGFLAISAAVTGRNPCNFCLCHTQAAWKLPLSNRALVSVAGRERVASSRSNGSGGGAVAVVELVAGVVGGGGGLQD